MSAAVEAPVTAAIADTRKAGGWLLVATTILLCVWVLLPIYLQSARGHTPTEAGLMILPLSAALVVVAATVLVHEVTATLDQNAKGREQLAAIESIVW